MNIKQNNTVDYHEVLLNGTKMDAIFDTGASSNFITKGALSKLQECERYTYENPKTFTLANDERIIITEYALIKLSYSDNNVIMKFEIINTQSIRILIGYETIQKMNEKITEKKEIPVQCNISTKGNKIISWNRPIKNQKDKKDFLDLVKKLEEEDIIEESTSLWLNPIVLTRKKKWKRPFLR